MSLKYPTQESAGNDEVGDSQPIEEGELGPPESSESSQDSDEEEGEVSPPETGENGCDGDDSGDITISESGQKSTSSKIESPKKPLKHRKATIMVAGRARNGKSTALNNIFGLELTAKVSAKSVTQVVSVSEVKKKIAILKPEGEETDGELEEEEVTLRVIDTPGLGATDISEDEILKDMKNIIQGEDYTLMYCFCVSPNQIVMKTDEDIVQNLQKSLGKEVWKKCVLLFTFSDFAYTSFDSKSEYIEHIKSHAVQFENLLNGIDKSNSVVVKTVFDYQSPEKLDREESPSEIIAIPVNRTPKKSKKILPGMIKKGQDWTDIVFVELMKKTGEEERAPFVLFRYPNLLLGTGTAGMGAVVGGFAGGAVGLLGGPVGVAAGAALGAAIGAVAIPTTGFTVKGVISLVNWITQ